MLHLAIDDKESVMEGEINSLGQEIFQGIPKDT